MAHIHPHLLGEGTIEEEMIMGFLIKAKTAARCAFNAKKPQWKVSVEWLSKLSGYILGYVQGTTQYGSNLQWGI